MTRSPDCTWLPIAERLCLQTDASGEKLVEPPCDVLLDGPESRDVARHGATDDPLGWLDQSAMPRDDTAPLPDHVCGHVARLTVRRWAHRRWAEDMLREEEQLATSGRPDDDGPIGMLCASWPLPVSGAAMRTWARANGAPVTLLPVPLIPDAGEVWLGLVVERRTGDAGSVVLSCYTDAAGATWLDPEPGRRTPPSTDDETRKRREGSLTTLEHRMIRWYQKRLQGQRVGPGKPQGAKGFPVADVQAAYTAALADLRREHIEPTPDRIVQYMAYHTEYDAAISRQTLDRYLNDGLLVPSTYSHPQ